MNDSLRQYVLNVLHIAPKSLINKKTKINKSLYIIRALVLDECFYPGVDIFREIIFGVLERNDDSIIKLLSIDMCNKPINDNEDLQSKLIKAIISEHFD